LPVGNVAGDVLAAGWNGVRGRVTVQIGAIAPHRGDYGWFESRRSCVRLSFVSSPRKNNGNLWCCQQWKHDCRLVACGELTSSGM